MSKQPPVPQSAPAASGAFPAYPWSVLPPELAAELDPHVGPLADLLVREISLHVPEYRGRRSNRFWDAIQLGCEQSLREFLQLLGHERGPSDITRATVRGLGRNEHEAGRALDALQMAYRIGARHAWRTYAQAIAGADLNTEQVTAFAESIFAFVDELAAESVAGYAEAQAAAASEHDRRRRLLLDALTAPTPDPSLVRRTATAAAWVLPERVRVISCSGGELRSAARAFGPDALVSSGHGDELVILWPDPDGPGRNERLMKIVAQFKAPVALGPAVPIALASRALRGARDAAALGAAGMLGDAPWHWDEHLVAIGLAQAEEPLTALADRLLAPLADESPGSRKRLLETLEAVLDAGGNHGAAAHALGVHVQTIRYRLGRLRDLLGPTLDDPARRFELHVALRSRRLAEVRR